tara:strand:- start:551 stop:1396 length:846 start_codon:yes stop_codon:yes gene_type:complete
MSSKPLRQLLCGHLEKAPDEIVVGTSAGIDSASIVVSALDVGKKVTVASFTLSDRLSNDFKGAKKIADYFDLDFMPIQIPTDPDIILNKVLQVIRILTAPESKFHLKLKKTTIETIVPQVFLLSEMQQRGQKTLVTGLGADAHFGLTKKAMIHYRKTKDLFQEMRNMRYEDIDNSQKTSFPIVAKHFGVRPIAPYINKDIFDIYSDATWAELNRPRVKETIRREFPEVNGICENKHVNLQLGDSGIAQLIGEVTRSKVAPKAKSPIRAYNILQKRGRLGLL